MTDETRARELVNTWGGDCPVHYHSLIGGAVLDEDDKAAAECNGRLVTAISEALTHAREEGRREERERIIKLAVEHSFCRRRRRPWTA